LVLNAKHFFWCSVLLKAPKYELDVSESILALSPPIPNRLTSPTRDNEDHGHPHTTGAIFPSVELHFNSQDATDAVRPESPHTGSPSGNPDEDSYSLHSCPSAGGLATGSQEAASWLEPEIDFRGRG
jgi:hypothetical protein